jgi:hypothetical protein
LAGLIWDRTGSYEAALWIFVTLWIIGAVIFILLRPPRDTAPSPERLVPAAA